MRARSQLFLLGVVGIGLGVVWLGCANANNGDPAVEDPGPVPTSTSTSPKDASPHPDFEAGFPDAGTIDPTPEGGDPCIDKNDPGASETTATALPDTDDAQNNPITVQGIMNGPVDIDFYKLKVADLSFHDLVPDLSIATTGTEMCVFLTCLSGTTNFKGCTTGAQSTSGIGDQGCCTAGPGTANPNWSCGGLTQTDDSAQLYIRIKQTADKCLPYSFSYAF
jgi:hypothetical protein